MIKNSVSGLRMRSMQWHREENYLWHICFTDHMSELLPMQSVTDSLITYWQKGVVFGIGNRLITGPPVVKSQGLGERVRGLIIGVYDGEFTSRRKYPFKNEIMDVQPSMV